MKKVTILVAVVSFSVAEITAQRAMTTDDIINMNRLASAILSPDGGSVIFG